MNRRRYQLGFLCSLVISLILTGCGGGGGGGEETGPFSALGGGDTVDVSRFNGTNIYTIISAQPSNKPEANILPSTFYPFTLTTAPAASPSQMAGSVPYGEETVRSRARVYGSGQTESDLQMRAAENKALASRSRQLSRRAPPVTTIVGTTWNNVYITTSGGTISTTCRYISDHAYFFVDNRDTAAMSSYLAGYGTAFDSIYEINHNRFGTENDTDGNGKVIIVFSQELELSPGLLGYFYPGDKYPKTAYAASNEGDIFYMTTYASYQGTVIRGTLAHEFQHMIYFDEHYDRGVTFTYSWLNEALSQAAEYYNGYLDNHLAWIADYLADGWMDGLSLTHWTSANYGYGAIFIRYLIDRYGDADIKQMCATNRVGVAAVENATGADFNTIFNDFTRALVMSGTGDSTDAKYNFTTLDLQAVQPGGRGGLVPAASIPVGNTVYSTGSGLLPYMIVFLEWMGDFGTMNLSGASFKGTAFGLSY